MLSDRKYIKTQVVGGKLFTSGFSTTMKLVSIYFFPFWGGSFWMDEMSEAHLENNQSVIGQIISNILGPVKLLKSPKFW